MKNKISRSEFLKKSFIFLTSIKIIPLLSGFFYSCSKIFQPPEAEDLEEVSDQFILNISDYPILENNGGSIALDSDIVEGLPSKGILIYRSSDSEVLVFDRKCPHAGIQVGEFVDGISTCAFSNGGHNSKFDTNGLVQSGVANCNLDSYTATINHDIITIYFNQKVDGC